MRALLLVGMVALSWAETAKAAVIDFSTLPGVNEAPFTSYTENGFTAAALAGNVKIATVNGNPAPGLFFDLRNPTTGSIIVSSGGQAFTFTSVDVRSGATDSSIITYTVTGFLGASQAFTQTGSAPGGPAGTSFLTVTALQPGTLIDSLTVSETAGTGSLTGNIDNIVVQAAAAATTIPEPASLALLGMSVAGIAAGRRRRAS